MTAIQTGPAARGLQWLAIPAASSIVLFLGYSSQWLFYAASYLPPGPLTAAEATLFNGLLLCLWWTYYKACTVDPGRYVFADPVQPGESTAVSPTTTMTAASSSSSSSSSSTSPSLRWCKKCSAPKPQRAHHCRHCGRCIPKMDHHCPWTGNCVSMQTFPHFLRFVVFTNLSLWMCGYLLVQRFYALWAERHLPAYLGPSLPELIHLALLGLVASATTLTLSIMLYTTVSAWLFNTTMIELWEMDRHESLVGRYRSTAEDGTFWDEGSEGEEEYDEVEYDEEEDEEETDGEDQEDKDKDDHTAAPTVRVEFPYDLGFFDNMCQAMGTVNVLAWFYPLAGGPTIASGGTGPGWDWPENGFNSRPGMWPPPDPEKLRQAAREARVADEATAPAGEWLVGTPQDQQAAFQARQAADLRRRRPANVAIDYDSSSSEGMDGLPGWTNADGDRLRDYGVDEAVDEDDEDVPLAALIQRRKERKQQ